jgi:hypothetical protein
VTPAFADGRAVLRVSGKAPLPDHAILLCRVFYGEEEVSPVTVFRLEVVGGSFQEEIACNADLFFPGIYRLAAGLNDTQLPTLRIPPQKRRLTGAVRFKVGGEHHACTAVNQIAGVVLQHARVVREQYPELYRLAARAFKRDLSPAEWKSWKSKSTILASREKLLDLLYNLNQRGLLRDTVVRINDLLHRVTLCRGAADQMVEDVQRGQAFAEDDEIVVAMRELQADPTAGSLPAYENLVAALLNEGRAAYAASLEGLVAEVEAAYDNPQARTGQAWTSAAAKWGKSLDDMQGLYRTFSDLDWGMDAASRSVKILPLTETLVLARELLDACGKAAAGSAPDAEKVKRLREDLHKRLALLKDAKR